MSESRKTNIINEKNMINIMYLPALILFCIFVFYPFVSGIRISFTNWNGFSQNFEYIGWLNYKNLLHDEILQLALKNTLIYGIGSTILQQMLGLFYAVFLDKKFIGSKTTRTVVYLPVLIAAVIMGYMWYFIFQYNSGALNDVLRVLGLESVDWLAKGNQAVWIITLVNTIQYTGVSMVIYLAGLQNIPKMYYEAAQIDGAGPISQFFKITLPLLYPAIVTSVTLNLIGGLKLFDVIKALTNGGPGYSSHSISTLVDHTYFKTQAAGYSSAMGVILFLIIMGVALLTIKIFDKNEVDM
ncbi:carbohydrate ABC transporter permease [Vallitalea okinawensis]|uniref:carbohydrate ABC transporter permease n=1 Tax=Vallitalea okinawensis TaxID=2078660 RepID=UPI000CFBCB62|nr:sugar ABC transporter permease [Vallitalea okinawensis]